MIKPIFIAFLLFTSVFSEVIPVQDYTVSIGGYKTIVHGQRNKLSVQFNTVMRAKSDGTVDLYNLNGTQGTTTTNNTYLFFQNFTKYKDIPSLRWNVEAHPSGWVNDQIQRYADQGVTFSNQGLVLRTSYNNDDIVSGRVNTNGKLQIKFGYIEAELKFESCIGIWPAFWMLGSWGGVWPNNGQIDIMEWVGRLSNTIFGTIHGPGFAGGDCFGSMNNNDQAIKDRTKNILGKPLSGEFHKYAINWEPNKIQWYIDNILYFTATPETLKNYRSGATWVFNDRPFYLVLNQAIGGNFGSTDCIDKNAIKAELKMYGSRDLTVRYVSVSKSKGGYGQVIGQMANINDGPVSSTNVVTNPLTESSPELLWHWYYIGNDKFFWQNEKYKTFLSARDNGQITLVAKPDTWQIWIKEGYWAYNNWRSAQWGKYISARDTNTINQQTVPGLWQRWVD